MKKLQIILGDFCNLIFQKGKNETWEWKEILPIVICVILIGLLFVLR